MERKKFIKNFAFGGSLLLTSPAIFNACTNGTDQVMNDQNNNGQKITVDLTDSDYSSLMNVGGFAYVSDIIVIKTGESQYVALSKICTHQGCTVSYNSSTNELPCPCHGSRFDISGNVVNGPAQTKLKKYSVSLEGNTLTIS